MMPQMLKVTGLSGEIDHYINLDRCDRIDLKKLPNCTAYNFYAHYTYGDINIAITHAQAMHVQQVLEDLTYNGRFLSTDN